jgi:hypothetical protein
VTHRFVALCVGNRSRKRLGLCNEQYTRCHHDTETAIYSGPPVIIDTIQKRQLGLFGHIFRMADKSLIKHILFSKIDGKSRRG